MNLSRCSFPFGDSEGMSDTHDAQFYKNREFFGRALGDGL